MLLKIIAMMDVVDVFITNYIYVDPEILSCWLEGLARYAESKVVKNLVCLHSSFPI